MADKKSKWDEFAEPIDPLEGEPDPDYQESQAHKEWLKSQPPTTFANAVDQQNDYESSKANPLSPKSKSGAEILGLHQGMTFGFGDEALAAADTGAEAITRLAKKVNPPATPEDTVEDEPGYNKVSPKIQKSWAPEKWTPPEVTPGKPTPLSPISAADAVPEDIPESPQPSLLDYYKKMRDGYRDDLSTAADKHPWQYGSGQLLGAAFAPIPGVAEINPAVRLAAKAADMAKAAKTAEEVMEAEQLAQAAKMMSREMRTGYARKGLGDWNPEETTIEGIPYPISQEAMDVISKYSNLNNRARYMAATGAATGAMSGLGTSNADLTEGDVLGAAEDMAVPALIGGGAGYAYSKVGQALAKMPRNPETGSLIDGPREGNRTEPPPLIRKNKVPFWKTAATVATAEGLGILAGGAVGSIGGPAGVIGGMIAGAAVPPLVKKLLNRWGQTATRKALDAIDTVLESGDQVLETPAGPQGLKLHQLFGKAGMPIALLRTPRERRAKLIEMMDDPKYAEDIEKGLSKLAEQDPDAHPDGGMPQGSVPEREEPQNFVRLRGQFSPPDAGEPGMVQR